MARDIIHSSSVIPFSGADVMNCTLPVYGLLAETREAGLFKGAPRSQILKLYESMKPLASFGQDCAHAQIDEHAPVAGPSARGSYAHINFAIAIGVPIHSKLSDGQPLAVFGNKNSAIRIFHLTREPKLVLLPWNRRRRKRCVSYLRIIRPLP